jgi:ketosteroid isomerase-like protein
MRPSVPSVRAGALFVVLLACVIFPGGRAMAADLTTAALEAWLARYGEAWETRDADKAAALFTPEATYHEMPFDAPLEGAAKIREYWARVTADQRDIDFSSKPIVIDDDTGVAEWSATFRTASTGATIELNGVFVLQFDDAGRCTSLREWWHVRQK